MKVPRTIRITSLFIATLLAIAGLVAVSTPAQAATATGTVTGVVKNAEGTVLPGRTVTLYRNVYDEDLIKVARTKAAADGSFTFTDVRVLDPATPDIRYRVTVTDPANDYLGDSVDPVDVKAGTTTELEFALKKAASISGKVTRADGKSPKGIVVDSWEGGSAVADANGNFQIRGMQAGTFELRYTDPSGDYLDQCYDNVLVDLRFEFGCETDADPGGTAVTVTDGANTTVKAQVLSRKAAHISGRITDTKNRVITGAQLDLFNVDSGDQFSIDPPVVSGTDGSFRINGIPPGTWVLRATGDRNGEDLGWAEYWWKNATSWAEATPIKVTAGQTVSGLAITMKSRSTIKVKATPGTGKATFAITITKDSSGSPAGGNTSVTGGGKSTWGKLTDGKRTLTLTGLKKGETTFTIVYSGSVNTAPSDKTVTITVK